MRECGEHMAQMCLHLVMQVKVIPMFIFISVFWGFLGVCVCIFLCEEVGGGGRQRRKTIKGQTPNKQNHLFQQNPSSVAHSEGENKSSRLVLHISK